MATLTIDSRIHVSTAELPEGAVAQLRAAFTYANPDAAKVAQLERTVERMRGQKGAARFHAMLAAARKAPKAIATWRQGAGIAGKRVPNLSLSRGGLDRVRAILERHGVPIVLVDHRTPGLGPPLEGTHGVELWDFQRGLVDAFLAAETCLWRSPTGCLSGSAEVTVNRAGKGARMRLEHVVRMFNGGASSNRVWDPAIETMVRAPFSDGSVKLAKLLSASESGVKPVYRVQVESECEGFFTEIDATADHRFMTPFGWVPLADLGFGDYVMVDGGIRVGSMRERGWYLLRVVRNHPHAGRRGVAPGKGGWTVPVHRLVAEARMNGLDVEEFVRAVDAGSEGLLFLDPKEFVVHHRDENSRNNDPDNLEVMTHAAHRATHRALSIRNITSRLVPAKIISRPMFVDEMPTFDLEVEGASAFMANGVAVHNSGKTTAAIAAALETGMPTLVVVWRGSLLEQWVKRAQRELGLGKQDVGVIQGSTERIRPLTIAMQQTLASRLPKDPELAAKFGCVVCDEVDRFAAKTFFDVVDRLPARYRLGVAADERRKDRKEFLIYDAFGEVVADVDRRELIDRGVVVDVEVRMVPTRFAPAWFVSMPPEQRGYSQGQLLDEMEVNAERNRLIVELAMHSLAEGEQVVAFSGRVDHCRVLEAMLLERLRAAGFPNTRTGLLLGGAERAAEFRRTIAGIESREIGFAAGTYQAVGYGIDLPALAHGIAATPIHNNRTTVNQVRGRLCRSSAGKQGGILMVLWDVELFGKRPLENYLRWNAGRVVVRGDGGQWVDGKKYLEGMVADEANGDEQLSFG